jgi:hypothetical protein
LELTDHPHAGSFALTLPEIFHQAGYACAARLGEGLKFLTGSPEDARHATPEADRLCRFLSRLTARPGEPYVERVVSVLTAEVAECLA